MWAARIKTHLPVVICFLVVLFLSTYKLTESPPIWMDEGIITQVSRNVAESGEYRLQVAPGEFVSAGFVTTAYPATLPVALSFKIFGTGILQARIVMVLFILALFVAAYVLARKQFKDPVILLSSLALLATFAPIYGDGRNVLGEIPGLLWLVLALIFVHRIDKGDTQKINFIGAGVFFGLTLVTKPVFIMLGPALLFLLWKFRKQGGAGSWSLAILALIVPVLIWLPIQFHGDTVSNIFSIYANPHSTDVMSSIVSNFTRFFTEFQPMYFFGSMVVWYASIVVRWRRKERISAVEAAAAIFAGFILLAYLRTTGYYRYFFLAQFFSIFFFSQALLSLAPVKIPRKIIYTALALLILLQVYQTFTSSWIAVHFKSTRTEEVTRAIFALPTDATYYLYQSPELALFLPTNNYYQYLEVTKTIVIGYNTLAVLKEGKVPFVLTNSEHVEKNKGLFEKYKVKGTAERYFILEKK